MTRYHGKARNALARAIYPTAPMISVRPWGWRAWLVILALAAALYLVGGGS